MKIFIALTLAAVTLTAIGARPTAARPTAASQSAASQSGHGSISPSAQLIADGCGPDAFRGPAGRCRPFARERMRERAFERRACPRGYHPGREGRRCWPN